MGFGFGVAVFGVVGLGDGEGFAMFVGAAVAVSL